MAMTETPIHDDLCAEWSRRQADDLVDAAGGTRAEHAADVAAGSADEEDDSDR